MSTYTQGHNRAAYCSTAKDESLVWSKDQHVDRESLLKSYEQFTAAVENNCIHVGLYYTKCKIKVRYVVTDGILVYDTPGRVDMHRRELLIQDLAHLKSRMLAGKFSWAHSDRADYQRNIYEPERLNKALRAGLNIEIYHTISLIRCPYHAHAGHLYYKRGVSHYEHGRMVDKWGCELNSASLKAIEHELSCGAWDWRQVSQDNDTPSTRHGYIVEAKEFM